MIKVGIYGPAELNSPVRKQLLRLLLRHPDVDLRAVASPAGNAMPLAELYPVYTGETKLTLERNLKLDNIDVLFVIDEENITDDVRLHYEEDPDFHVIVLGKTPRLLKETDGMEYGFPEYNRKALVRGARAAVNPSAAAMLIELALFPLAKFGVLESDVHVRISGKVVDLDASATEARRLLQMVESSFDSEVIVGRGGDTTYERLDAEVRVTTILEFDELERIYNETYEDHNFAYLVPGKGAFAEDLRGSNKCLIRLDKESDTLTINASIDAMTRGVTGNAVHIMNLFFGLYERTGLSI